MRNTALILITALIALSACGADDTSTSSDPVSSAVAQTGNSMAKKASRSTTVVSPEATAARAEMGPEAGIEDFDAAGIISANADSFKAGTDYLVLTPAQPTSSGANIIEVTEVFMYSCPHCFNFEPFVKGWLKRKPIGVNFVRVPAQFNKTAQLHAAAYYAAEALGVTEQVHLPLFRAIHTNRNPLSSEAAIKKILTDNGVDGDEFSSALASFNVDAKTREARNLSQRYRIQSVPTLVINGKYVTSGSMAKSLDRLNDLVDYLVAREMVER